MVTLLLEHATGGSLLQKFEIKRVFLQEALMEKIVFSFILLLFQILIVKCFRYFTSFDYYTILFISFIISFIVICAYQYTKKYEHWRLSGNLFYAVLYGLIAYSVSAFCTVLILKFLPIHTVDFLSEIIINNLNSLNPEKIVLVFLVTGIFVPVFEELVFRYYFFNGITTIKMVYKNADIIITVIFFSLCHLYSIKAFVFSVFTGLFITFFYKMYKSIVFSVIMHFTINTTGLLVGYLLHIN